MSGLDAVGPIVLVGAGNMGAALLEGWLRAGLDGANVTVVDPGLSDERAAEWRGQGVRVEAAAVSAPQAPDLLFLAVKPQIMDAVLGEVRPLVGAGTVVASVAAGVTLVRLREGLGETARCVRVMPNTPAQVGRGASVCCATPDVDESRRTALSTLLQTVGTVEWIADEALMDAVTAVSGSGPAYVFRMTEALAEAGTKAGLPADLAARLALATVGGAGELMHRSDEPPASLRRSVTSPGGTTEAALAVLEAELPDLMARAVDAAARRSRELR